MLQRLKEADPEDSIAQQLLAKLPQAASDTALAAIVAQAADLIQERAESFAREQLKSAAVLSQVTERLEEMAGYLTETGDAARTPRRARATGRGCPSGSASRTRTRR